MIRKALILIVLSPLYAVLSPVFLVGGVTRLITWLWYRKPLDRIRQVGYTGKSNENL